MRKIDAIVVHCTATPDAAWQIGVKQIRADHVSNRGWHDIGYHYLVRRDGEIECGRMESEFGAHCQNGYNQRSIGVAWAGIEKPTAPQRASLVRLVVDLSKRYGVQIHEVKGHKEADPGAHKACPVIDMIAFRSEVSRCCQ